jgi:hypothetical protein
MPPSSSPRQSLTVTTQHIHSQVSLFKAAEDFARVGEPAMAIAMVRKVFRRALSTMRNRAKRKMLSHIWDIIQKYPESILEEHTLESENLRDLACRMLKRPPVEDFAGLQSGITRCYSEYLACKQQVAEAGPQIENLTYGLVQISDLLLAEVETTFAYRELS